MVVSYKNKFNTQYGFDKNESHSIEDIAKITGYTIDGLQTIYDKGIGAYHTNPQSVRPQVKSAEQWAMARIYSAVMGGKAANIDKSHLIKGSGMNDKIEELFKWSNPKMAQKKAYAYLGKTAELFVSDKADKKYEIYDPNLDKYISFGQMNYEDFTKHKDTKRQENYLKRACNMKGNWRDNPYSPNNLSINILW
jgi:hypothetical protein